MYNLCVNVTTAQPNAYDNKADENRKNANSQNSLSSTSNANTKRTVIKIGGMQGSNRIIIDFFLNPSPVIDPWDHLLKIS
jgi:hypothetical protein